MLLAVNLADVDPPSHVFRFIVTGGQQWTPRSFRATAVRDNGGTPDRAYELTISDGTNTVAAVGAPDAGVDPGSCIITWCNTPAAAVASNDVGVVVAPLPPIVLKPGYVILGEILNPAPGDFWESAVCWTDFVYLDS